MDARCLSRLARQASVEVRARELMLASLGYAGAKAPQRWVETDLHRHMIIAWGMCLRFHGYPVRIFTHSLRMLAPESELPMVHHEEMYFLMHENTPFGVGASGMDELLAQFKQVFFPHEEVSFQLGPMDDCIEVLCSDGLCRWGELLSPAFSSALARDQAQWLQSCTQQSADEGGARRL